MQRDVYPLRSVPFQLSGLAFGFVFLSFFSAAPVALGDTDALIIE